MRKGTRFNGSDRWRSFIAMDFYHSRSMPQGDAIPIIGQSIRQHIDARAGKW